jgi:hypothetical protein
MLALVLAASSYTPSLGQSERSSAASLKVIVVDPSGAAIPKAEVTVASGGTKPETMRTAATGEATFSGLKPGHFRVGDICEGICPT